MYYELKAEREKQGKESEVALIRVEQLAPFPFDLVCRELRRYPNAEIMWCALLPRLPLPDFCWGCPASIHIAEHTLQDVTVGTSWGFDRPCCC